MCLLVICEICHFLFSYSHVVSISIFITVCPSYDKITSTPFHTDQSGDVMRCNEGNNANVMWPDCQYLHVNSALPQSYKSRIVICYILKQ